MLSSWPARLKPGLFAILVGLSACHVVRRTNDIVGSHRDGAIPHIDSALVAVNGARLFYEAAGSGPTVVLIHGGNLDRRIWDPQFLAFAKEHRVIRYDARGFGRSSAADTSYQAHEDLFALLAVLKVQHASLVGLSMGGRIAIDFALEYPSMVDRLVLASPGISGWQFWQFADTSWKPEARLARSRGDSVGMNWAWIKSVMAPALEHPELAARIRELASDNSGYWAGLLRHGDPERVASPPALHRTGMLRAPTLLVVGTRDGWDAMQIADTLTADVRGLRRVMFEGAGHMVNMEQPARFTELVLEFLRP